MANSASINIITGRTGTAHVSSADDASVWRGFVGNDNITLYSDNKFSLDYSNARTLVISSGVLCINGHMGRINNTITLNYSVPDSGYKHTLVIVRYAIDNGIESMTIMVLQDESVYSSTSDDLDNSISIDPETDYVLYEFFCGNTGVVADTLHTHLTVIDTIPMIIDRIATLEAFKTSETSARQSLAGRVSTLESASASATASILSLTSRIRELTLQEEESYGVSDYRYPCYVGNDPHSLTSSGIVLIVVNGGEFTCATTLSGIIAAGKEISNGKYTLKYYVDDYGSYVSFYIDTKLSVAGGTTKNISTVMTKVYWLNV